MGLLAVCLAAITLPYLWVWLITPQGMGWGGLLWKADDQNVHLAWARQAELGQFFVRDLFTTEGLSNGETPRFFNVLPFVMGILARWTGTGVIFWYHAIRILGTAWAVWQFYGLTRSTLPPGLARVVAVALLTLTTGTGFLLTVAPSLVNRLFLVDSPDPGNFPTMPEAFFFTSAFAYPLYVIPYGLLAYLARCLLGAAPEPGLSEGSQSKAALRHFLAFGSAAALSNIHTYDALPMIVLAAGWGVLRLKAGDRSTPIMCLSVIAGCLLPLAYQVLVFRGSEEFRVKALTPTLPPAPVHLLATFAPLLVLAIWGLKQGSVMRHRSFAALWVGAISLLVYAPGISFARKIIEGVQMPLILLAATGLATLLKCKPALTGRTAANGPKAVEARPAATPRATAAAWIFIGAMALSPANFVIWCLGNAAENNSSRLAVLMPPLSLTDSEWGALEFVNANRQGPARSAGATLCLPFLGSYGPRTSGTTYYLAHWAETLHFQQKLGPVNRFYRGAMTPQEARAFLRDGSIRFVVQSQYERAFFGLLDVGERYGLPLAWQGGSGETRTLVWATPE